MNNNTVNAFQKMLDAFEDYLSYGYASELRKAIEELKMQLGTEREEDENKQTN